MERAIKSTEQLRSLLPDEPFHLSVSLTKRYPPLHPKDTRTEEEAIRPLQYMTWLHDVDRGVLFTRPYFDMRMEPEPSQDRIARTPPKPRADPSKPITKLSLQDYKNRKKEAASAEDSLAKKQGSAPQAKSLGQRGAEKEKVPPIKKEPESTPSEDMQRKFGVKKTHPSLPPRPDVRLPASPSPDLKKRRPEIEEDRQNKRSRNEGATLIAPPRTSGKPGTPLSKERPGLPEKKPAGDKPSPMSNGRSTSSSLSKHGVSPRPSTQLNGSQKSTKSILDISRKEKHESTKPSAVPPLLSPLGAFGMEEQLRSKTQEPRSSPVKKPLEKDKDRERERERDRDKDRDSVRSKAPVKSLRVDVDSSSTPRKTNPVIPALLSPTLPAIVREEQALQKKLNSSREASQKVSDAKKTVKGLKEDTIHVGSKKEADDSPPSLIVRLKYPRSRRKDIERLLALPPKRKTEAIKKNDRVSREQADSLDASSAATARKRPRATTDAGEQPSASKRPRTSEIAQPTTPSKQGTAMQRVASSSSQIGTPGANGFTPAAPGSSDRRQASADPELAGKHRKLHNTMLKVGTRMKHARDGTMKAKDGSMATNISTRDRNFAMAAGIQSTVAYLISFKSVDDANKAECKPCDVSFWNGLPPVVRMYTHDCVRSGQLSALILRLLAISLGWYSKALCNLGAQNAKAARELFQCIKDQEQAWKQADSARKSLGVYDGSQSGDDGGSVAKLIDRLGPWSTSEDTASIALAALRKALRHEDRNFTLEPELVQFLSSTNSGSQN